MIARCRRLIVLAAMFAAPALAATDYTDTWWTPAEPGWGVNLTQNGDKLYATFYVYAVDGRATWFAALMSRDGTGDRFTGTLSRTTGTFYGAPAWTGYTIAPAGAATFSATSSTTGTLTYAVDGTTVTKSIERITLAPLGVAGTYIGGVSGRRIGCSVSGAIVEAMQFIVLHSTFDNSLRIDQVSTSTGALVCRMEGTAVQTGKLLSVTGASYSCSDGWNAPARIFNLRPTTRGFEAEWFSEAGGGCTESGQLSGVTQFP